MKDVNVTKLLKENGKTVHHVDSVIVAGEDLQKQMASFELENVYARFQESDQDTWEAQQECAKPELGGAVFKTWARERYGIKWWKPDPNYGLIFQAVDFGGSNPHAIGWYQVLNRDLYWWEQINLYQTPLQNSLKLAQEYVLMKSILQRLVMLN